MSEFDPVELAGLDDDALLERLARTLEAVDPVPPAVRAGALGAETWRTIDAELAELVFDSALETTGTRATTAARELTFRAGEVEIELLLLEPLGSGIEGQVIPPVGEQIELASLSGAGTAPVDELGRFRFAELPTGPVRLGLLLGARWVYTSWLVLRPA